MPVMDGLQATQAIRAQGSDIPIVALTANNSTEDRDACFAVGMDEFLTKPINKNKLQTVLQSLIKN
jgi:CheY-like chemotaxis protein